MDAAIYKANEKMTFLANDKEILRLYNMREMAQIDFNSGMRKARTEGETAKALAIASRLLNRNRPIDEIIEDTGFTREDIEALCNE